VRLPPPPPGFCGSVSQSVQQRCLRREQEKGEFRISPSAEEEGAKKIPEGIWFLLRNSRKGEMEIFQIF